MSANKRVKEFRQSIGLTQKEFSNSLGIKQGSYSDLERGKIGVSSLVIKTLIKIYRINPIWLYDGEGDMYLDNSFDLKKASDNVAYLDSNKSFNTSENNITGLESFSIPIEPFKEGLFLMVKATDDGMVPSINKGDLIIGKQTPYTLLSEYDIGETFILVTTSKKVLVRQLSHIINHDTIGFKSKNPEIPPFPLKHNDTVACYKFIAKLNFTLEENNSNVDNKLSELEKAIKDLQNIVKNK